LKGRTFLLIAAFLLTTATGLRIYHVGGRSLWSDEAIVATISRGTLYDKAFVPHPSRGTFAEVLDQTRTWGSYPVFYPCMLYLVEKVGGGPIAVRAPSVLASILAVLVMLAMGRVGVSRGAALFSAAILAVSTAQIRYAQEAREYSLSILFASVMIFCFLQWIRARSGSTHPLLLYAALFLAPFIQYGLVLFAFGILTTIGLLLVLDRSKSFRLPHAVIASASLGAGGATSLLLTLRYQLGIRRSQGYLAENYFEPKTTSVLHFLFRNSRGLLGFMFPGRAIVVCFVIGAIIFCIEQTRRRKCDAVAILAFTSVLITAVASIARVYPYGGIRQCLFLAPALALFAGVVFASFSGRLYGSYQQATVLGVMALILLSGCRGIFKSSPYREVEDIQSVLKELSKSSAPSDQVYVYPGAGPAVDFYLHGSPPRFIYGEDHRDAPQNYAPELLASINRHTDRVWLVFSHMYGSEEQEIVDSLRSGWDVQRVVAATGAALYVAGREPHPAFAGGKL
jgi:hypothetical protein